MANSKRFIFMPLLFISVQLFSQRPPTGTWVNLQLPVKINNKWQIHNDASYRTLGNSTSALQHLYRTGIKYNITNSWSATAGIAFSFVRTSFTKQNHEFSKEYRFWQEVNYKTSLTQKLQLQTRLRAEERFFGATNTKSAYHAFRYRVRPQLQYKFCSKWAAFIADEYMQQHANSNWSFDQNRLMVSGIYFINTQTQLQAGYMWLRFPANSSQHIVNLTFQKTISLHAK
jgi:hypothetical protein